MEIIDKFVSDLESFLGVARTPISLADEWKKTRMEDPESSDLSKYLETVSMPSPLTALLHNVLTGVGCHLTLLQGRHWHRQRLD